jgi:transcriptional regulator with XRE-family HTH domain
MRLSSIYQLSQSDEGLGTATLGSRIRELRMQVGLTQTELGSPMTRSFVSAIEHGRVLPSLPALLLISARLGVPAGRLLEQLEWTWQDTYTGLHAADHPPPSDGR